MWQMGTPARLRLNLFDWQIEKQAQVAYFRLLPRSKFCNFDVQLLN